MTAKELKKQIELHKSQMIKESHEHSINPRSIRLEFMEGLERVVRSIEDKQTETDKS